MDRCSYFIQDKALFGSFPSQETVDLLENEGVRCFIDLTDMEETKTTPYSTNYKYIKYPIADRKIPEDWKSFAQLVVTISDVLKNLGFGEKVYVHCKGGHGRSGILVACIFCYHYGLRPDEALRETNRCHSDRKEMRDKWRRLGSPQGKRQKDFVFRFFRPLKIIKPEMMGYTMGLHNLSCHSVSIPGVGAFPNAQLAFQYFRDPNNKEYVKNLLEGKFIQELLSDHNRDWEENKIEYMYQILKYKFSQHENIRNNLLNTGLRPFVKISHDNFWGDGGNFQGRNIQGKLLNRLRSELLLEDFYNQV